MRAVTEVCQVERRVVRVLSSWERCEGRGVCGRVHRAGQVRVVSRAMAARMELRFSRAVSRDGNLAGGSAIWEVGGR